MPVAGPFYFAWVDATDVNFGVEHHRMDEYIYSAKRTLTEGDKPKLELVMENPRVGLLSALRKKWCWFSWDSNWGGTPNVIPLFFGRLVGIPTGLQEEVITVMFIAWPSNYTHQLQKVAETLKVPPFWDAVFIDVAHRDDPLTIFEAHSKLICVDATTLEVSASDILDAEDGNVDFTADDHFYDNMNVVPGAVPKTAIYVDATVSWTQTAHGFLDMGGQTIVSLGGDGILSDWPKPGASIAQGLMVHTSSAIDTAGVDSTTMITQSWSYQNKEEHHEDGDTLSASWSYTAPSFASLNGATGTPSRGAIISETSQTGLLDPFAVDGDGDPKPINIGASYNATMAYAGTYIVSTTLSLEYTAARPHTERVVFILFADVQSTTLDPLVTEDSESIVISGADVGIPLIDLLNWTTIGGTAVDVGTIIFPNDPRLPGGQTVQICVVAGIAGDVEPEFSDIPGEETVDGTVVWASLGTSTPTINAQNWSGSTNVPTGTLILPQRPVGASLDSFTSQGNNSVPPTPTNFTEGQVFENSDGTISVVTQGGQIGAGINTATLTNIGVPTDGSTYFVAIQGGTTGTAPNTPGFGSATSLHSTVADGGVVWANVGSGAIPIGGTPGNVTASSYFASARGLSVSLPYLICRARARLRYASRAVSITFSCSYLRGTELTLRKSATLHDHRLPGGLVLGKITGTELIADSGAFTCNVTMQSAVGLATEITPVAGTASYVTPGYVDDNFQVMVGQFVLVPTLSDVAYSPIIPTPDEDNITFPLTKGMLVISEAIMGNNDGVAEQAFRAMKEAVRITNEPTDPLGMIAKQKQLQANSVSSYGNLVAANPVWYDLVMKPLNGNGSFNHVYHLKCTHLSLPKMIDLAAESTT